MSVYEERPWLAQYPPGLPHDIELDHPSALAMYRATAARLGDRPAIHYFDHAISWNELDAVTDGLAAGLLEHGLQRGDRVAVDLQSVPQFVMAVLATWKAGGVMVSVNPMLKQREVTTLLADSGARALITLESLWASVAREVVGETEVEIVITTSELDFLGDDIPALLESSSRARDDKTLDLVELAEQHRGAAVEPVDLGPDDVAFLTYTSGTTGPPKGAMNTHRNVVFNSQTYREWGELTEDDAVLGVAPLFHITGLIGHVTVTLLTGMPLILSYRFDAEAALELVERHRATFTVGAITVFIALMNAPDAEQRDVASLRKVLSGGAPIAPPTVEAFERRFGTYIHNVYGLTETTSPSHFVPRGARAPVDEASGALSVGVPVFNTVVRIVGDDREELPPGEIGEMVTEGPQVVPGYWNKPEETENAIPGGRLHTGDVGVMDADGWFYVVERKKDQINAAGYKVWPREVEDVIYAHEDVREVAVVGVPDEYRGETVKAFVAVKEGASLDADTLIAFCKERMAAYKYPRQVEFIDELPKTASGKVLRRELRAKETGTEG
jgi:long-chain acyl-CoA synthetase